MSECKIELNHGFYAVVSEQDYDSVSRYKWHIHPHDATFYARTKIDGHDWLMQRYVKCILDVSPDLKHWDDYSVVVDHVNGRGYDNRRNNIRWVTLAQNNRNQHSCEWHGVRRHPDDVGRWQYLLMDHWVGSYPNAIEAAVMFDNHNQQGFFNFPWLHRVEANFYTRLYDPLPLR